MTPEEMTYLAVLLFSIPVGFAFNGRGPRTRQWGAAALGAGLTLVTCGAHALHSLVTSLVTWALVRLMPRRCGGAALAWTFGYLLFFRTLWVWGWPQPPPYANALQLMLTLKMVSMASDVQERWEAEPAGVTSSELDELIGSVPPCPSLGETLCYSYCYLGLLTGPFYRLGTHRDWVLCSAPPGSWRLVLRRLRWVPLWGLTGEAVGRLFPGGLRDPRLWGWGFPRRLFAMGPAFLALRARFYVGWGMAEGACMAAGFGGSPPGTRPTPGCGATRACPRLKGPPPPPELWDFAAIRTCSPRDTERAAGVGAGLRGWNRTVQWWLVRYVHARARGFSPALRNAWTMLFSAFWHGLHPGIYLSFLSVPLWLAAEGALGRLLGGVPKVRGLLRRVPPGLYSMRVFEYLAVGFILRDLEPTLRYWGSVYFCLHWVPLLLLALDAILGAGPGRGGGAKGKGEGPGDKAEGTGGEEGAGPGVEGEGLGVKGEGPGDKGAGSGVKGEWPGVKGEGPGVKGAGPGVKWEGPGVKGAGPGVKGEGLGVKGEGLGVKEGAGPGVKGEGLGVKGEGLGVKEGAGPGVKGAGPGVKWEGPGVKWEGPGVKGEGPQIKGGGPEIQGGRSGIQGGGSEVKGERGKGPEMKGGDPEAEGWGPEVQWGDPEVKLGDPQDKGGGMEVKGGTQVRKRGDPASMGKM